MIRILKAGDEALVEQFLAPLADTSMLLLSNLQRGGLVDRGLPLQGTWAGAFDGDALTGLLTHTWLNTIVLQAPRLEEGALLARAAADACQRPLKGLIGPEAQVIATRQALGLARAPTTIDRPEVLFTLDLRDLRVPEALASGRLTCRPPVEAELPLLVRWRMDYCVETGLENYTPELEGLAGRSIALAHGQGNLWVLHQAGQPVATTAFNARLPSAVQIGGVWTPPELRGRGYARAAVAGQLLAVRAQGVSRGVLFTGQSQHAAQAAYRALGFREAGDYGLVYFRDPPRL